MIPNDFTVSTADWANEDDRNACRTVREQVYILEQKVREEERTETGKACVAQGDPAAVARRKFDWPAWAPHPAHHVVDAW